MITCKSNRQTLGIVCGFAICFIFLSLLMCCVPLVSDDLEFAALEFSGVSDLASYILHYGNGRVLGNLGSICLSQLPVLGIFVKAFIISGIIFLVPWVLGIRDATGYLLSFVLFMSIRPAFFGQVYTWTSGFQNYLPPIWSSLVIIALIQRYDSLVKRWAKAVFHGLILFLSITGQLYVEHCSLMNVLLAAGFVYLRRKEGRRVSPAVNWLIGSVIGLGIMFAVPVVFSMEGNRSENYRSVNLGGLSQLVYACATVFTKMGAAFPPLGAMAASLCAAATTYFTRERRKPRWNTVLYFCCAGIIAYFFVNEFLLRNTWYIWHWDERRFLTACFAFLPFLLWVVVLFSLDDKTTIRKICFLLLMAILSLAPFAVASPSPARVLFFAYTCTVAAILLFYRYARKQINTPLLVCIRRASQVAAVTLSLMLLLTFANIAWISNLRDAHIRQEMDAGKTHIVVFEDPYTYVHWSGSWCYGMHYYYEKPNDIRFTAIDFENWYNSVWLPGNGG